MIKLIKSTFYEEEKSKLELAFFIAQTSYLSFGKQCELFEKNFSRYQERKQCVFLNSGSSANLAIIQALLNLGKIKQGDLVGFSALTWSTNVMPLLQLGLQAVPIDVELDTLNVSSNKFEETITKFPVKLLFLTNLLGFCDDIDKIQNLCEKNNIILIEDNCESLGTIYKGKKLGNYGLASTFSFYVGHHMSTIEGGAVCTDNEQLASMLKMVRAHGWDRNLNEKSQNKIRTKHHINSSFYSRYTFYDLGYNLRPTEINGFLGNQQVKYLDKIVKRRNEIFLAIAPTIYKNKKKYFPIRFSHIQLLSNFAIPVICRTKAIRDQLVNVCKDVVEIRPVVAGDITQQPFFSKHMSIFKNILGQSNAKLIHDQGLYFGNNPDLTDVEINTLIKIFA